MSVAPRLPDTLNLALARLKGARASGPALRLWRRWAQWSRYHGVFGPGIHLLRNLTLQHKTLLAGSLVTLLLLSLILPLAQQRAAELTQATNAVLGAQQMRQLGLLQKAVSGLGAEADRAARSGETQALVASLRVESEVFDALGALRGSDWALAPSLERGLAEVQDRRQTLRRLGDGANAHAGQQALAARAYGDALQMLRLAWMGEWATKVDADPQSRILREGLVGPAAELLLRLRRLLAVEALAMAEPGSATYRSEVHDLVAELRTVLAIHQPMLQRAHAVLPGQSLQMDEHLGLIERMLGAASSLSRRRDESPTPLVAADLQSHRVLGRAALGAAEALEAMGQQALKARLVAREAQLRNNLMLHATLLGVLLVATFYLLVCMYKVLDGGLRFLGAQVAQLGKGNLSIRPTGHGRDEIGAALNTLSQSAANMSALFEAVTRGVASVSHASREVASGNAGLSGRNDAIRQSIGTVAERTQSFADALDNCGTSVERVAEHVRSMRHEAQRGRRATASLHERMRALQGKSREIVQVVALVEAVAHHTKLLALNASVEAGRAGAAGKGFAVVAKEVRALANRSEAAAQRIRGIVDGSVNEIEQGNLTADRVAEAVARTDEQIQAVSAIMGEIVGLVRDGQQQSRDVLNIARDVDDAAGGNARVVEQLSQASSDLRDQGDSLKRSIQHFVTS